MLQNPPPALPHLSCLRRRMSLPWALAVLLVSVLEGSSAQTVDQTKGPMTVPEGKPVSLKCNYQAQGSQNYLFWYVQNPGHPPRVFLREYGDEEGNRRGFRASHDSGKKTYHLEKPAIQLQDSAVYFCAVRGTGNYKVIYGQGTRLTIQPDLPKAAPSVYELKPVKEDKDKLMKNLTACLFTDYFPGDIEVKTKGESWIAANSSLVIVKENGKDEPSYGTVLWDSKDEDFTCSARVDGDIYNSERQEKCVKKEGKWGPAAATSAPTTTIQTFETDETLNTLSITVLGLRIIFLKAVAFNVLLTYRLRMK